jgi:hypothetical protein
MGADVDTAQSVLPGMPEPLPPPPPQPFEVTGSAESRTDLTIDLAGLIRKYQTEYNAIELATRGYEPWERPMVFLYEYLSEHGNSGLFGDHHVKEGWDDFEFNESPSWTRERFEALVAVCPEAEVAS